MRVYNRERNAYIELDISDTLKNFINNVKNLCNISCIAVKLYDINDILDHFSEIKIKKCHKLNFDAWNEDDDDERQYITNVDIDVYNYDTWKKFEDLMIAKTIHLVDENDENGPRQEIYIINTGLEWTNYEEVTLQIFVNGLKDRKEKE